IIPGMDAEEKLEIGDKILGVDGEEVLDHPTLLEVLGAYSIGDIVNLTIEREEDVMDVAVEVRHFPEDIDETGERGGIGIANP
ncbi:PDZ domain-containing protein, partial [Pseudomonas sp. 2995-3]|uniref:PDZ domain-containing protein n=1 Tax=Pseudomonas sp. 2995-3 TaxID=1712680 RepID=UPI000C62C430